MKYNHMQKWRVLLRYLKKTINGWLGNWRWGNFVGIRPASFNDNIISQSSFLKSSDVGYVYRVPLTWTTETFHPYLQEQRSRHPLRQVSRLTYVATRPERRSEQWRGMRCDAPAKLHADVLKFHPSMLSTTHSNLLTTNRPDFMRQQGQRGWNPCYDTVAQQLVSNDFHCLMSYSCCKQGRTFMLTVSARLTFCKMEN
jgi:hypothetical protein